MAALLFDYRGFGSSEGAVRNLVDPQRHLDDWRAVIACVRAAAAPSSPAKQGEEGGSPVFVGMDPARLALWGTSMAGGHVLVLAAEDAKTGAEAGAEAGAEGGATGPPPLRAVVAQSPHLDGRLNRRRNVRPPPEGRGLRGALRITRCALQDFARAALGWAPAYVPIVGPPESVSLMPLPPSELELYFAKHPRSDDKGGGWRNLAPARVALQVGSYSPIDSVPRIRAPTLLVAASQDTLCPPEKVRAASELLGDGRAGEGGAAGAEFLSVESTHFGLYSGPSFDLAAAKMVAFLKAHL